MRRKKPSPLLSQLLIEDYAAEGKCIARQDGKVIFIEGVVPGDRVDVRITKSKKDWAEGVVVSFVSKAADRVAPFCDHFGVCGGCQWQMLPYTKQLQFKQQQVEQTLQRIGKVTLPTILPIAGATQTTQYRNKIEYTFGNKRYLLPSELGNETISNQSNVAGFHARGYFDKIVDIDTCHLQAAPSNEIRHFIKKMAVEKGWSFYDSRAHQGYLRNLQLRLCRSGELMVNLIVGEERPDQTNSLLQALQQRFPAITTLLYTVNQKWNDSIIDLEPVVFSGKGFVEEILYGADPAEKYRFKIGPQSFFQTNTAQAETLYRLTATAAALTGQETLYDLYCGTGSIGIFLSRKAGRIVGVEQVSAAIEDAKENARINQIHNASFYAGDVAAICNDTFFEKEGRPDVIITDPPRAGMHETLVDTLRAIAAPVIVYVSCNPATQARDLQRLDSDYQVTSVQPVDMFPHTHHIENIVQLRRR
ncbi:MAG: 23S rRNA (uracil(1939)-C(5))-methyltransferase RlmD [Sphingomonadales bacterium]|nr:23S rRNA (uracil(1939)-C(5))-methyltransferase RlmD [Sphingomonadales bacterium]